MIIRSESEMLAFGASLAAELKTGDWLAIDAPLGAGKTVLCAGILKGLGFIGEVASPSYAIVIQYAPPEVRMAVQHADLYRLKSVDEIEELGLLDASCDCITLVEWAKNGGTVLAHATHRIEIDTLQDGSRIINMITTNG
jgi:tRNA threonylcarbamoyladenosine biosynthesis protein TsaE